MKIGILSDTHDFLDPSLPEVFAGVDRLIHAGDVCQPSLIAELTRIAPVTVVRGNNDLHPGWPLTEVREFDGVCFLVEHIVQPRHLSIDLARRIELHKPQVVVFGHSHRKFEEVVNGILFLNPGSAGKARWGGTRSVCVLDVAERPLRPEWIELD